MRLSRKPAPSPSPVSSASAPTFSPRNSSTPLVSRGLHYWALLTALVTFVLVGAGGLVTSHGVGMAVPDWPNSYGYNMFFFPPSRWVGGIFYEHTHRLIASATGLMTSILAIWLFGRGARRFLRWLGLGLLFVGGLTLAATPGRWTDALVVAVTGSAALGASWFWPSCDPAPRWLRRLGLFAFGAVVLQGVLGGLRVILFKDQIGIFHALLAQLFLALTCALALFTSKAWRVFRERASEVQPEPGIGRLQWLFAGTTLLIVLQLILGATMRHQHAGLSIPDFPLAYGKLWPATDASSVAAYNAHRIEITAPNPITSGQIILQMAHRMVALAILLSVATCAWRSRFCRQGSIRKLGAGWLGLIVVQVLLGAATIWSNKAADIATAHVLVGALSLVMGVMLCLLVGTVRVQPVAVSRKARVKPELELDPGAHAPEPAGT